MYATNIVHSASAAIGRYAASGPVVVHDLDVGAGRVEHERCVVAGVVTRSLARRSVVRVARSERCGMERIDGVVRVGPERQVQALGRRPLVVDQREARGASLEVRPTRWLRSPLEAAELAGREREVVPLGKLGAVVAELAG